MFKLQKYFIIVGGLTVLVFSLILVIGLYRHDLNNITAFGERQNIVLAHSLVNALKGTLPAYLALLAKVPPDALRDHRETAAIDQKIRLASEGLPVLKVKLFTLNGLTLYSSVSKEIGQKHSTKSELFSASLQGRPASKMAREDAIKTFTSILFQRDIVETYVPITDRDGAIIAIIELYTDITDLLKESRHQLKLLIGLLILGLGLMFGVLLLIIKHADTILSRQYRQLAQGKREVEQFKEGLEETVANRTNELTQAVAELKMEIAHRQRVERELSKLSLAVEQSPASVMITDPNGIIEYVNPKFTEVTGWTPNEIIGQETRILGAGATSKKQYEALWKTIISGREWRGELHNRKKNGDTFWEQVSISPIKDSDGSITHFLATKEDISLRREYEERLIKQANYDTLTGIANRLLARDRISQALHRAKRNGSLVGLMFIDLDDFKKINDTLGHPIGDKLLIEVAHCLKNCLRHSDTIARIDNIEQDATVARLGGDEFTIVLPDMHDIEDSEVVAEQVLKNFQTPFAIEGHELLVTASIGIALYPLDGQDVSDLMRNADAAMYHAKETGRNTYRFYTPEMNQHAQERLRLEGALSHALEAGELDVHYQPLIAAGTGQPVGAEALLRWHSAELGEISPGRFISIAETTGLIIPIGLWVLRTACATAATWPEVAGQPLYIAVNMSSRQFQDPGLLDQVRQALNETGLRPERLMIEVTESVILDERGIVSKTIDGLRALGISLAIDDFGTGYSALSYLQKYPFDTLKIDRAFITHLSDNEDSANLVRAIISMAQSLRLTVVAEGVETEEQQRFLKQAGCNILQGWLFGRAMPRESFSARLEGQTIKQHLGS